MRHLRSVSLLQWLGMFIMVALCCTFSSCSSRKVIINGLDERDANEILVFLAAKNIDAYKIKAVSEGAGGGKGPTLWDISVDNEKVTEAMALLNANGLPRRRGQNLLEIFAAGGLVPSEMQDKIRYQAGLSDQIASTIRKIDGVLDADVQLSFPEEDPLNPRAIKPPITAAVFVKHNGILDDPNSQLIPKIRRFVAASVQGLSYDNVTVIADRARFSEASDLLSKQISPSGAELVRVWTIPIAKGSVGRFQAIFVGLITLTALFVLATFWLLWKIIPVAQECGGISHILSLHPLELSSHVPTEIVEGPAVEEKGEALPEEKKPKVQENVESP